MPNGSNLQWVLHKPVGSTAGDGELGVSGVGGEVKMFTSAAALNIGDLVYFSAADTVNKSAVAATTGIPFAGVVVGGESTNDFIAEDAQLAGAAVVAATSGAGKRTLVQVSGIAWVTSDAAAIAAGLAVTEGTGTAGRVSVTGATAGQIVGTTVTASAAGATKQKMLIDHR